MILGITGTRLGLTDAQWTALPGILAILPAVVLHGGAEGVDEELDGFFALRFAREASGTVEVYPTDARYAYWTRAGIPFAAVRTIHEPLPPLVRNELMVRKADHILAFPAGEEIARSGTWHTIRCARRAGKEITIVMPDGEVREERQ